MIHIGLGLVRNGNTAKEREYDDDGGQGDDEGDGQWGNSVGVRSPCYKEPNRVRQELFTVYAFREGMQGPVPAIARLARERQTRTLR